MIACRGLGAGVGDLIGGWDGGLRKRLGEGTVALLNTQVPEMTPSIKL